MLKNDLVLKSTRIIPVIFSLKPIQHMKKITVVFLLIIFMATACDQDIPDAGKWPVSSPKAQGMDRHKIDQAYDEAARLGFVDGLLVIRNGYLVAEGYYNGYDRSTPHQLWSDTKSFISALIGIAYEEGLIESLDKKVMDYFPEYAYEGMDPRFYDVTIRHLLTMRMGIDNEEKNLMAVVNTDDWIKGTFDLPLIFDPGERFSYNSLETHLLSVILTKVSGMSSWEFANIHLAIPMNIQIAHWYRCPKGYNTGGYNMYLTPCDMAFLGYLYLNDGKMNGSQIVPEEWVNASLQKTWAKDGIEWGPLKDYNYGYLWWLGKMNGYNLFMALGMGGQYIINFPELNLIVVTTANKDISWDNEQELPILQLVSDYILTAI